MAPSRTNGDRRVSIAAGVALAAAAVVAVVALLAGGASTAPRPLTAAERVVYDRIVSSRHVAGSLGPVRPPNATIEGCTLRSVSRVGTLASVRGTAFIRPLGEIAVRVHQDADGSIEISLYDCR